MSTNPNIGIVPSLTLGQRLRVARELTGMEQQEFAREIGTSRQTIGAAERGISHPRQLLIRAWAMATGVDRHWLETGEAPSPGGDGTDGEPPVGLEPTAFALQGASVLEFPTRCVA